MNPLPTSFDGAMAMLGDLVHDPNLVTGLVTVGLILAASGLITWVLLSRMARR